MSRVRIMFVTIAAALGSVGVFGVVQPAHAVDDAPTQCTVPAAPQSEVVGAVMLPSCDTIQGLCLHWIVTGGVPRAVHSPSRGVVQGNPCASFDADCIITVEQPATNPPGPSRGAHGRAAIGRTPSVTIYHPGDTFDIPGKCVGLPSTGADTMPALAAGATAIVLGAALVVTRRRFLRSSRIA